MSFPLIEAGCWAQRLASTDFSGKPALFLDRDGVVVVETEYLGRAEDVQMIQGVGTAIAAVNARQLPVVLVTNQAGVGRGYYGWDGFAAVQAEILRALAAEGARLDAVMACAYHAEGLGEFRQVEHNWRKPAPGMIRHAAEMLGVDLARSYLVGDNITDIEAAMAAGVGKSTLVLTGYGAEHAVTYSTRLTEAGVDVVADAPAAILAWLLRI